MKLTRSDREAFVRAVLQDVPRRDFKKEMTALMCDEGLPLASAHRDAVVVAHCFGHVFQITLRSTAPETESLRAKLDALQEEVVAADRARAALRTKLEAAIGACSTLAAAKRALPEFEKYLPKDRTTTGATSLPAVANLVADLTKLGWPKDKEPDAKVTE